MVKATKTFSIECELSDLKVLHPIHLPPVDPVSTLLSHTVAPLLGLIISAYFGQYLEWPPEESDHSSHILVNINFLDTGSR